MAEIQIPAAPELLPKPLQDEWKKTWLKEFKQAQVDHDGDEALQRAVASRAANRVLNPDDPTSYQEAKALADWQCINRGEKNGKYFVVLINAKKFSFDIPVKAVKEAPSMVTANGATGAAGGAADSAKKPVEEKK